MKTITTNEIVADPKTFVERLEAGESFTVTSPERTLADIVPVWKPLAAPRPFGLCKGEFVVPEDFDDPLPDDILDLWEGRTP